jgi:low affinity Fe/Cu permease
MARQLGSALGVAFMVAVLGVGEATGLVGFQHAWMMVIVTAALTGLAGLFTEVRRDRFAARLPRTTRQMA